LIPRIDSYLFRLDTKNIVDTDVVDLYKFETATVIQLQEEIVKAPSLLVSVAAVALALPYTSFAVTNCQLVAGKVSQGCYSGYVCEDGSGQIVIGPCSLAKQDSIALPAKSTAKTSAYQVAEVVRIPQSTSTKDLYQLIHPAR
jgi:hypothetical protein